MKTISRSILALGAAVATATLFAGNVYYVDPKGSDSANGLTPQTARQSLAAVMKLVTKNNGDIVYAAEGTYTNEYDGTYRVKVPAGTKLIASGSRDKTFIEGAPADGVSTTASPWGCGTGGLSGVYLNAGAELHGFTVRNGHGTEYKNTVTGGGVCGADRSTCIVYDCAITNNVGGQGAGVTLVTAIRCDIGCNTAARYANMNSATAYSCYLHEENVPGDNYGYGYCASTLNGCTIDPKMTGSGNAGVNGATCINCYTRNERNNSTLTYTAYTAKGNGTVVKDGSFNVTTAQMALDAEKRPVLGSNLGIERGDWFSYTNGASAQVLAYLDKDYAGKPRLAGSIWT